MAIKGKMAFLNAPITKEILKKPLKEFGIKHNNKSNISRMIAQIYAEYLLEFEISLSKMEAIKPVIEQQMEEHRPNLKSRQSDMTIVNKVIRELVEDYNEQKRAVLFIPKKDRKLQEKEAKARVEDANDKVIIFNKSSLLKVIKDLKTSDNIIQQIVAVGLSTGARFLEIVDTSVFEQSSDPNMIIQNSLGKQNSIIESNRVEVDVEKPIIGMNSDKILDLIDNIREVIGDKTTKEITVKYNPKVNEMVRRIFTSLNENEESPQKFTFKLLRKIYPELAYMLNLPRYRTVSKRKFLMDVLGHKSMDVGKSYSNIKIFDEPITTPPKFIDEPQDDIFENEEKTPVKKNKKKKASKFVREDNIDIFEDDPIEPIQTSQEQLNMLKNPYGNKSPNKQIELLHRASSRFPGGFTLKDAKKLGFSKKIYDLFLMSN